MGFLNDSFQTFQNLILKPSSYRQNAALENASKSNNRCIDKMPLQKGQQQQQKMYRQNAAPKNASNSNN
jgi:hypothetical protein